MKIQTYNYNIPLATEKIKIQEVFVYSWYESKYYTMINRFAKKRRKKSGFLI